MEGGVARQYRSQLFPELASLSRRQLCDKAADTWSNEGHGRQALDELIERDTPTHGAAYHQHIQKMFDDQTSIFHRGYLAVR